MATEENKSQSAVLVDLEDLEECAIEGRAPRKAIRYRIKVDKEKYVTENTSLTGQEILELASKTPAKNYGLHQRTKGNGRTEIALDETVDFTQPGIERFTTIPLDQTEG